MSACVFAIKRVSAYPNAPQPIMDTLCTVITDISTHTLINITGFGYAMKKKVVIITGTPGTGKSTIATFISKHLGYHHIDAGKLILRRKLAETYDRQRKTRIIDEKKVAKALMEEIKRIDSNVVVDSPLAHFLL